MPHFIFIQQISVLNILNILYNLHFFSSKCRLFHNATLFGFYITHILNTGCAKIWKKKSVAKRLKQNMIHSFRICPAVRQSLIKNHIRFRTGICVRKKFSFLQIYSRPPGLGISLGNTQCCYFYLKREI